MKMLLTAMIQDDLELKKNDTIGHSVFGLSNRTKTCTIRRLIKGNQLLAGNLGTEFEMISMIYYLLYGSEISTIFCLDKKLPFY